MKKAIGFVFRFVKRISDDKIPLYATQASFFIIFSVMPFIMLLLTLAKYFVPMNSDTIITTIYNYLPLYVATFLNKLVNEVLTSSVAAVSASAFTAVWLSSKGIMALILGLNNILKPDKAFNYIRERLLSVLYTAVFVIVITLTIAVFGFGQQITDSLSHIKIISVIARILKFRTLLFFILLTLIFASFYTVLPRTGSFIRQLPGASAAAIGWIIFSHIYSIYIEHFSKYSYVYGSLTAVMLLMLWLYICMNILLYGAELNKLKEEDFFKFKTKEER